MRNEYNSLDTVRNESIKRVKTNKNYTALVKNGYKQFICCNEKKDDLIENACR